MAEDDVHLVGPAALVGAEHDGVRGVAVERGAVVVAVRGEELEVRASALEAVLEGRLVLERQAVFRIERRREGRGDAVLGRLRDVEAVVLGAVSLDDGRDAGVLLVGRGVHAPRSPPVNVSRKATAPVTSTGVNGWTASAAAAAPWSAAPSATAPVATVISFMIERGCGGGTGGDAPRAVRVSARETIVRSPIVVWFFQFFTGHVILSNQNAAFVEEERGATAASHDASPMPTLRVA